MYSPKAFGSKLSPLMFMILRSSNDSKTTSEVWRDAPRCTTILFFQLMSEPPNGRKLMFS